MAENGTKETKPIIMEVDPELWTEAKIQAIRENKTLREYVSEAIREKLDRTPVADK